MVKTATPKGAQESSPSSAESALLKKYAPLVRRIAFVLHGMKPAMLDHDDVMQDGMIGLLRAIRSTRGESAGARFTVFASSNIRGAIIDGYRAAGTISRGEYTRAKRVRQAAAAGTAVSAADKAAADRVLALAWTPAVAIGDVGDEGMALHDRRPGPEQRAMSNQALRVAVDVLQRMPVRERTIFIACELEGERQVRLAERFGVSTGRVSQILKATRADILRAIA